MLLLDLRALPMMVMSALVLPPITVLAPASGSTRVEGLPTGSGAPPGVAGPGRFSSLSRVSSQKQRRRRPAGTRSSGVSLAIGRPNTVLEK